MNRRKSGGNQYPKHKPFKVTTVNLCPGDIHLLEAMVACGEFAPSRSELIRIMIPIAAEILIKRRNEIAEEYLKIMEGIDSVGRNDYNLPIEIYQASLKNGVNWSKWGLDMRGMGGAQ